MSLMSKLAAVLVALGTLALIALAPSAAFAHGGHGAHAGHRHAAVERPAVPVKAATAGQELRAAAIAVAPAQHGDLCGERGCCGNGHCAGCVNALAATEAAEFDSPAKSVPPASQAILPPGLSTSGPPRPPRSLA